MYYNVLFLIINLITIHKLYFKNRKFCKILKKHNIKNKGDIILNDNNKKINDFK